IVYTTDHGEFMGEHGLMNKGKPYDTAYHIPFIMCWPNGINAGTVVDNVVSNVDFLPTILGVMGFQSSGREQGNDGSGLLKGRIAGWKDESFIHHRPTGCLGIYTREYVLCYVNGKDHILFDRKNDPDEINNLFGNPAYQDVVDELTARLIEHNIEVGNPEVQWLEQIVA
ncbi:MAG: sulfatase-like hydrolase/transferase, partial [Planctomycetes bacterium]|nr:sulfatase-like hydrolase/transferase [Planctomycetota bacterium]